MVRLIDGVGKNSPEEYNKIFQERRNRGVDEQDVRRWRKLLNYYRGGRLLDMGCLDSLVPALAREWYSEAEVWGIDLAEDCIAEMQATFPYVTYMVADVYDTKLPKNYFDYIVAGELIEHLDKPEEFLKEAFRILKHGGILAISTPKEEEKEQGAVDAERHVWSWNEDELKELLEPYGKTWFRKMGSQYFPTYKYHFPTLLAFTAKHG